MWNDPGHAHKFDKAETIYLVVEPDEAGAKLRDTIATSAIRDKVKLISAGADVRDFRDRDRKTFPERWTQAKLEAKTFDERERADRKAEADLALPEAGGLEKSPDIIAEFLADVRGRGYVGEEAGLVATFLTLVSVLLRRPVSFKLEGVSSVGKSALLEAVLTFFPPSYFLWRTTMTKAVLFYSPRSYEHVAIVFAEAAALHDDDFIYALRSLVSEGFLQHEVVEKNIDGKLTTRVITKPGPTALVLSTTSTKLDPEIETRMLAIGTDDSKEQTARVIEAEAIADEEQIDGAALERWIAFLTWLRALDRPTVSIPYRRALGRTIPPVATRLRRDFRTLTSCIEAHALLHRATRQEDERGRIVATLEDYEAVRRYLGKAFSERVDSTVPTAVREAVEAVKAILERKQTTYEQTREPGDLGHVRPADVGYSELAEELGIDPQAARRRALKALDKGWLRNMAKPHQKARLAPGDPLPKERHLLPTLEQLQAAWEAMTTT